MYPQLFIAEPAQNSDHWSYYCSVEDLSYDETLRWFDPASLAQWFRRYPSGSFEERNDNLSIERRTNHAALIASATSRRDDSVFLIERGKQDIELRKVIPTDDQLPFVEPLVQVSRDTNEGLRRASGKEKQQIKASIKRRHAQPEIIGKCTAAQASVLAGAFRDFDWWLSDFVRYGLEPGQKSFWVNFPYNYSYHSGVLATSCAVRLSALPKSLESDTIALVHRFVDDVLRSYQEESKGEARKAFDTLKKGFARNKQQEDQIDLVREALLEGEAVGISEAAEILSLSTDRVRDLAQAGRIGVKVGRNYIFTLKELAKFEQLDRPAGKHISK